MKDAACLCEYEAGINAIIADFVCLWKYRMTSFESQIF